MRVLLKQSVQVSPDGLYELPRRLPDSVPNIEEKIKIGEENRHKAYTAKAAIYMRHTKYEDGSCRLAVDEFLRPEEKNRLSQGRRRNCDKKVRKIQMSETGSSRSRARRMFIHWCTCPLRVPADLYSHL